MTLAADPARDPGHDGVQPSGAILPARGLGDRVSAVFWRHPNVLLATLLALPLLWLVVVYLG